MKGRAGRRSCRALLATRRGEGRANEADRGAGVSRGAGVVGILAATGAFKGGNSSQAATTATTTTPAGTAGQAEGLSDWLPQGVQLRIGQRVRVPIPSTLQSLIPRVQAIYVTLGDGRNWPLAVSQAVKSRQLILR